METLNSKLDFKSVPGEYRSTFIGNSAQKICFLPGVHFFKFTQYGLVGRDARISPWWSGVKPVVPGDPGLEGTLQRAARLGILAKDYSRARNAVTKHWNSMEGLLVVRLLRPAWGFVGRCAHQRLDMDAGHENIFLIGGAWQVYLPGIRSGDVAVA